MLLVWQGFCDKSRKFDMKMALEEKSNDHQTYLEIIPLGKKMSHQHVTAVRSYFGPDQTRPEVPRATGISMAKKLTKNTNSTCNIPPEY